MTDSPRPTRIKVIRKSMKASPDQTESLLWGDCLFCTDAAMTDYDWVLVYDEFPRTPVGTIRNETEPLLCPPDQTILITVEPPSIKIYSRAYTSQFGTVLTTHSARDLPHPGHTLGRGCLEWLYIKPMQEILDQKEFPKTKMLSTICSAKQHTHTMHKKRYDLTRYLADRLPELDWFGHGIREIENKTVAMDDYKYHLCVENHLEPHHWTEKLSDAFVAMTLPFYAGDPLATECFPQESFIPIPLDNPQKALEIIRKAMEDGEYEKRLPAIREARRLVLEKYNMFAQTAAVIHNHPARIEEVVAKVTKQVEEEIIETGKRTAIDLGIHGLHPELVRIVGKMKYRSSYGQNLLQHARETANLCAVMASELGLNPKKAKRAGLLHDIGKVPDEEPELPHAIYGAKLAEKYKEKPDICNAIGAHHDEMEMTSLLAPIVQVCDAISGARPGARREIVEAYIKRLNDLENIAMSYPGVTKTYAIQAGRELRVIVGADKIDDKQTESLSGEIAKKIQDEMTYPGQVKITVIRETRSVSYAK